jgi:hypothetical protein
MKKLLSLLLAVLYMTTSSGVVLNVHYCMGKIASVEVDNFRDTLCKCGKQETGAACCKSEIKVLKNANDHMATLASFDLKLPPVNLPTLVSPSQLFYSNRTLFGNPSGSAPPGTTNKTYIENCVFRI